MNAGLVKDAGLFAGAYMVIQMVSRMKNTEIDPIFDHYPHIQAYGYIPILTPLLKLEQPIALRDLLRTLESFLETVEKSDVRRDGFETNRVGNNVIATTKTLVDRAKRTSTTAIALTAIDFERDEMPILEGMIDDSLRNMLLAHY